MTSDLKARGRVKRHRRVRKLAVGTEARPRLAVYRSNRQIYAQLIDDSSGRTLVSASSQKVRGGQDPTTRAKAVGRAVALRAADAGIKKVTFDRGGFRYHGRVKSLAEGAREGGLDF
ncbi:MAG: 50S ribosomal protein L18 [Actinomycetota bacterium]|nr:50S ribosomal protein L18 [Actinomycetota bacterium]